MEWAREGKRIGRRRQRLCSDAQSTHACYGRQRVVSHVIRQWTEWILYGVVRRRRRYVCVTVARMLIEYYSRDDKKFELMLTRRAKAYSSSGSVVELKIGVFTLS